jgi:hypothetical protein
MKLGLRDWSDVLGMASLTGWNPAVVARAGERCARVFDENMLFRTFHEATQNGSQTHYTEHLALDIENEDGSDKDESSQPSAGRVCPHESCPRHTIPFRKEWYLQRHLTAVHERGTEDVASGATKRRRSSSARTGTSISNVSEVDDDIMIESPDVIVCPVPGCPRSKEPFSLGKRLYEHVRNQHPELDVRAIKKLEAIRRGERRGRWTDERRRRSASGRRSSSRRQRTAAAVLLDEGGSDGEYEDG